MKRAGYISYNGFTYNKNGIRFHYCIDDQDYSVFNSLKVSKITLNDRIKDWVSANVGMSYLVDLCTVCLPQKVLVCVKEISIGDLSFWKDSFEGFAIERIYDEKLKVKFPPSEWKKSIASHHRQLKLRLPHNPNKILIAISGGKESLTMLKMFEGRDKLLFFLQYPDRTWYFANKAYQELSERFETFKVRSDVSSTNRLCKEYGCETYSLLVVPQIIFNALYFCDRFKYILMGNEYSANFGNTVFHGIPVNHQVDKTINYFIKINAYLSKHLTNGPRYFSPFFGFYEYALSEKWLQHPKYFDIWTSCNNSSSVHNFCCKCPKCAFIYAITLPFIEKAKIEKLFWRDMLNDLGLYKPLMDFDATKPVECVGEKKEVWVAFSALVKQKRELKKPVIKYFVQEILPIIKGDLPKYEKELSEEHFSYRYIPKEYVNTVRSFFDD